MCEYVSNNFSGGKEIDMAFDEETDVGGITLTNLADPGKGFWECWHPETDSWEAMYLPPVGMALKMSPGSKVRYNTKDERPEHTKNTPPPEKTPVGTQMRDLIPSV